MSIQSKFRLFRLFLNLVLFLILGIIIFQNSDATEVDILWWKTELPLAILLLGVALLGSLITFFGVIWLGRN